VDGCTLRIGIDLLGLKVGAEVVQELTHGSEVVGTLQLEGDGLEDLGSEWVVPDLFQLRV
jgi:hypothetical protein